MRATILTMCGALVLVGCGDEGGRPQSDGHTSLTTLTTMGGTEGDTDGITDTDGDTEGGSDPWDGKLDVPSPDSGEPPGDDEECASYSEAAENMLQPADIIFIVDNSGSMGDEAAAVQDNLNAFSQQIIDSGVDAHVVLISSYPSDGNGICVDPPLGAGGCPNQDTNLPTYLHVDDQVGSHNALQKLLNNYATWAPSIRPESGLHLVVVTDDESSLDALSFDMQFKALDPDFADHKLHGIVSKQDCSDAADIGDTYITLGQLTGGIVEDLCAQNFQPVFDLLATEVIAGSVLACEWEIPEPPNGEEFDPDKVNVEFGDGMGNTTTIGRVDDPSECPNVNAGWYYDNPADPTLIIACPQTCEQMQNAMEAHIEITLGCATQPAG